jgi:glucose-1-phosphate thymidylyltransferase
MKRKGIILAGGTGSRLFPITLGVSKQLLPVYDKPMIYYPLSVLMLGGMREIAIVTTPEDQPQFQRLLGTGEQWGLSFTYITQAKPEGIAQVFVLAEEFLAGAPSALILGDNLFYGHGIPELMARADARAEGATIFVHPVSDARAYGVVTADAQGRATSIVEKPKEPPSNLAVTGLYVYDAQAVAFAKALRPSGRGELEITDLNRAYLEREQLSIETLGRGFAWLDTGTPGDLIKAGQLVEVLQERQGLLIASPEEIAFRAGWIGEGTLRQQCDALGKGAYSERLRALLASTSPIEAAARG